MSRRLLVAALLSAPLACASVQAPGAFVPPGFEIPRRLETSQFVLRPLVVADAGRDFEAVTASEPQLREIFPDSDWPSGLTLDADRAEIQSHEALFTARRAFTYAVVGLDGQEVLGSVYINPSSKVDYDAEVYLWRRAARLGSPEDRALEAVVRGWVMDAWPFERPALPGRTVSWAEWRALPDVAGQGVRPPCVRATEPAPAETRGSSPRAPSR